MKPKHQSSESTLDLIENLIAWAKNCKWNTTAQDSTNSPIVCSAIDFLGLGATQKSTLPQENALNVLLRFDEPDLYPFDKWLESDDFKKRCKLDENFEVEVKDIFNSYYDFRYENFKFTPARLNALTELYSKTQELVVTLFKHKQGEDVIFLLNWYDKIKKNIDQFKLKIFKIKDEFKRLFEVEFKYFFYLCASELNDFKLLSGTSKIRINKDQLVRTFSRVNTLSDSYDAQLIKIAVNYPDEYNNKLCANFAQEIAGIRQKMVGEHPGKNKEITSEFESVLQWKKEYDEYQHEYQQWVAIQKDFSDQSYRVAERRTEQTKAVDESLAQVCKLANERCQKLMGSTSGETPHETGSQDTGESNQLAEAIGDLKSSIDVWKQERRQKKWYDYILLFFNCCAGKKASSRYSAVTKLWGKVKGKVPEVNEERSDKKNNSIK
jgi:hypothetical protein